VLGTGSVILGCLIFSTGDIMAARSDPSGEVILYQTDDGVTRIEVRLEGDTVWLSQKAMAELFQKDVRTVNDRIRNIFEEGELRESSVILKYRITAADGKQYDTLHYNLVKGR
jgi:hypothetical protein